MSLEVFGTSGDGAFDADDLYRHGWESDANCEKWWRNGESETIYTFAEACEIYEEWRWSDD